ncbi:MGH1-like glycoside hydrolase domain-containing protein [Lacibacter sp.]|uniref:MGH1-like glycoside hydrolase domain-containing protein n=1 Tax=Lacibacter sp. TaxID=1915409 RepID=UPI002B4AE731|nr:glycosyl hydrolase family 65 protein [Lacibacter sp.]HLP37614.1 glycosyl hydrolase family 65 protein [Lacibacter sp.]
MKQSIFKFLLLVPILFTCKESFGLEPGTDGPLKDELLKNYVNYFNAVDQELYKQHIPNSKSYDFLAKNIPLFECPDKSVERTYYFRWWTYRKHIKKTPVGYIITEFLPDVSWSATYNAITCPGLFHFNEGRWLKDPIYLNDYANFWVYHSGYHKNEKWRHFKAVLGHAFPLSDAILQFHKIHPQNKLIEKVINELAANYEELKKLRATELGLYWSNAGGWEGDGMEVAVGGNGIRPTVNSYMYSQAKALSEMYLMVGDKAKSEKYKSESAQIADSMMKLLWDDKDSFFKVVRKADYSTKKSADVRELFGYVPWCYSIPPKNSGYEKAWLQILDKDGFYAPYGLTTCEQRHPGFKINYEGHECQWNGPSWPYATSQTLVAMANVIQEYPQNILTRKDYLNQFLIYTNSQTLQKENGFTIPWIDENLNPYTGDWIARTMLKRKKEQYVERGKDYNHSTYVDLLISGLIGLKPRMDNVIEINPCLPENTWDYFCLDRIPYKGHQLTIIWDKTGNKYNSGKGLTVLSNGKVIGKSENLNRILCEIK